MKHIKKNSYFVKMLAILLCVMMAFSTFQMGGFINADAKDAAGILPGIGGSQLLEITEEDYTINNLFTYDGNPHSLEVEAEGFTVEYKELDGEWTTEAPQYVKAGYYTMSVRLSKEGYKTLLLRAEILNILPAKITDVNVSGVEATYGKDNVTQFDLFNITGLQDGDIVEYTVNDGEPQVYNKDAAPKVDKADVYKVVVTVKRGANNPAEDEAIFDYNYKTFTAEVTTTINPGSLEGIVNIAAPEQQQYNGQETPLFTVDGVKEGDKITYTQAGNDEVVIDVTAGGKLDIAPGVYIPGPYSIDVTVSRENYNDLTATIIYNIADGTLDITGLVITGLDLTFEVDEDGKPVAQQAIKVDNQGDYTLEYKLDDGEYSTEIPMVTDAGQYTVTVRATKKYYVTINDVVVEKSESAEAPHNVYVEKKDIEGVKAEGYTGVFDQKEHDVLSSIEGIIDGDVLTFSNAADGEFTAELKVTNVAQSDTYYVKISRQAEGYKNNYKDLVLPITVSIEQAELFIEFEETKDVSYKEIDKNTFKYVINKIYFINENDEKIDADEKHNIVYSTDCDFASVASDGTVTYTNTGDIVVNATLAGPYNNYKITDNTVANYTVKVYNVDAPEFTVTGPNYYRDVAAGIDWYSGEVVITPAEGWVIIEADNDNVQNGTVVLGQTWSDSITKNEEAVYNDVKVAFKKLDSGEISPFCDVADFAIDKTNPMVTKFTIDEVNEFEKAISFLSFGIFGQTQVKIFVEVSDEGVSSGIKDVVLYTSETDSEGITGTFNKAKAAYEFILPEEALDENQRLDFILSAKVTDNVGYESEKTDMTTKNSGLENTELMIENIMPEIFDVKTAPIEQTVEYEYEGSKLVYSGDFSFSFSVTDADSGIHSVDVIVNNTAYDGYPITYTISGDNEEGKSDTKLHTADYTVTTQGISAVEEGKYEFKVVVVDNAGNAIDKTFVYYVDKTAPSITEFKFGDENDTDLESDVVIDNYGFWFKDKVDVTVTALDPKIDNEFTSGLKSMTVYLHDVDNETYYTVYKAADNTYYIDVIANKDDANTIEFNSVNAEQSITFTVPANFKGQIYAFATDNVDNAGKYVHPDASVVEDIDKHENTSDITIAPTQKGVSTQNNSYSFKYEGTAEILDAKKDYDDTQLVPLYSADVDFVLNIKDTYSGIRDIKWTIFEGEIGTEDRREETKSITVNNNGDIDGDIEGWVIAEKDENLVTNLTNTITVSGNHNDMVLLVELTDRAGNTSYDYYVFGIDKTAPVITIVYDDDKAVNDEEYIDFFNTNRTATITITERNFNANDVVFAITNTDKVIPNINLKDINVWTMNVDESNLDKTTYTATINYTVDGDYTFEIAYTDKAGNANEGITCDSIAPYKFTIDKTKPTVNVVYDNNSALNGNYYKADRVATITVTEHNFDAKRFVLDCIATDNGLEVSYPSITEWKKDGDVYTTTISYTADAKYTFDFTFKDMSSNEIDDFATEEFYVDKTSPVVSISGIVDQSANNDEGDIGFTVTATDTNFDKFLPVLTGVVYKDGSFETKTIEVGSISNVSNGKEYVVKNIDTDGIYSITCTVVDKAGNAYTQVILQDADGKNYIEKRAGADILAAFSVNRLGSTFTLNDYTQKLIDTYYVKDVTNNVTIIEINPDPIVEQTITLNGKTLEEGKDYNVSLENSETSWYKYSYSINKELFADENEYNIVVTSKDKATNEAFSDVKNLTVKFVVDRTAPVITVTGLKDNGRYQVQTQKVTISPSDDGGMLKTLIVRTVDENGNIIKEIINLSGDELIAALEAGDITFELTETEELYQYVQIISEDFAGNVVGATDEEIYSNVTITTNAFLIFWANQPLRWGSIAGVILLTAAIIFLIVYKKRKKAAK